MLHYPGILLPASFRLLYTRACPSHMCSAVLLIPSNTFFSVVYDCMCVRVLLCVCPFVQRGALFTQKPCVCGHLFWYNACPAPAPCFYPPIRFHLTSICIHSHTALAKLLRGRSSASMVSLDPERLHSQGSSTAIPWSPPSFYLPGITWGGGEAS